jgi:NADH-quinone oxidoreductase subunit G
MIKLEVDGKLVEVPFGATVMEAATKLGIFVPHFCWHRKLSIAANCRMCLVQVEKVAKPLPACATPATEGMKVFTASDGAIDAQKGVMEFLLINHPLDCPICDQGGECQLQDLAVGYGASSSRYTEEKRVVVNKNLGPLIATDMTRCIHCTRCVRFGQEVAGVMELGMAGRGEHAEILAFVGRTVDSEISGNMIDLCPVGALTSKPFRFAARTWELSRRKSISPHDGLGSNLVVQVKQDRVMRVLPLENSLINECWLSDRDRFSYEGLHSEDRLTRPQIKRDDRWVEVSWEEALDFAARGLRDVIDRRGPMELGALVSPQLTLEELHLAGKLVRGLGSKNIDYRMRQGDFRLTSPRMPWMGSAVADLQKEEFDSALLVGSTFRKEHPLVASRLRKGAKRGWNTINIVHVADDDLLMPVANKIIARPSGLAMALGGVAKAISELTGKPLEGEVARAVENLPVSDAARAMAKDFTGHPASAVLLGNYAQQHPDYSVLLFIANEIARLTGATIGVLSQNANSVGAHLVGARPVGGVNARDMILNPLRAYITLGIEPELDSVYGVHAAHALDQADFVVDLSAYRNTSSYADVILPIVPFSETGGTFVSMEGRVQSFNAVVKPMGDARPGWKVLRMLATKLGIEEGFEPETIEEVRTAIAPDLQAWANEHLSNTVTPFAFELHAPESGLERVAEWGLYDSDPIVRRATSLSKTADKKFSRTMRMNAATAASLGLASGDRARIRQGEGEAMLPVAIDNALLDGCVRVARGIQETAALGEGPIAITKVAEEKVA